MFFVILQMLSCLIFYIMISEFSVHAKDTLVKVDYST